MNAQLSFADITASRHGGNRHSQEAHKRILPKKVSTRERCRVFVGGCGFAGATIKEICQCFGVQLNQLSGRLTELRAAGLIFDSGRTRNGCAVYVTDPRHVSDRMVSQ